MRGAKLPPLIDEHVQAVGEEVRELAKLHAELARAEVREGTTDFVRGVLLCAFGVLVLALTLVAAGVALFFLAHRVLTPAGAAGVVTLVYLVVGGIAVRQGIRRVGGLGALLLPRTRAMLWELVTCRDKSDEAEKS